MHDHCRDGLLAQRRGHQRKRRLDADIGPHARRHDYWCAQSTDNRGGSTSFTTSRAFTVNSTTNPTLLTPTTSAIVSRIPTLTARFEDPNPGQTGMLSYRITSNAACTTIVDSGSTATGVSIGTSMAWTGTVTLTEGATYYWCASATDSMGASSSWTAGRSFVVNRTSAPVLVDPADGADALATPTLTATFQDPNTGQTGSIEFRISTSAACTTAVDSGSSAAGIAIGSDGTWTGTVTLTHLTTYYWCARSVDNLGDASSWSASLSFVAWGTAPSNLTLPRIAGTTQQGYAVTAQDGTWRGFPTSYSYQWQKSTNNSTWVNATGAGNNTKNYSAFVAGDVGMYYRVQVQATNVYGTSAAASSAGRLISAPTTITFDGVKGSGSSDDCSAGLTVTLTGSISSNSMITIWVAYDAPATAGSFPTLSDSRTASYSSRYTRWSGGASYGYLAFDRRVTSTAFVAGDTMTLGNITGACAVIVGSFSGMSSNRTSDNVPSQWSRTTSTTLTAGSVTPLYADGLVLGGYSAIGPPTDTYSITQAGWTAIPVVGAPGGGRTVAPYYRITSTTSTLSLDGTLSNARTFNGAMLHMWK